MRTIIRIVSLVVAILGLVVLGELLTARPTPSTVRDELVRRGATPKDLADLDFASKALRELAEHGPAHALNDSARRDVDGIYGGSSRVDPCGATMNGACVPTEVYQGECELGDKLVQCTVYQSPPRRPKL